MQSMVGATRFRTTERAHVDRQLRGGSSRLALAANDPLRTFENAKDCISSTLICCISFQALRESKSMTSKKLILAQ